MLKRLYIRNYALFAETEVTFRRGLNVLTGETGAGKSMLIGALGLIMGARSDSSAIFLADEKCVIEAEFGDLSDNRIVQLALFEDFDLVSDGLTIRREISPSGKSRAFINDTPVTLEVLRAISGLLLDLHGQHENVALLSHESQLDLLDTYASVQARVAEFGKKLTQTNKLRSEIDRLRTADAESRKQMDYILHQVKELEGAHLREGEEEELEAELNRLQHSEDIRMALGMATETMYNQENALYTQLGTVITQLRKVATVDATIAAQTEVLVLAQQSLRDASFSLQSILEQVEVSPERLSFIEERIGLYHNLKLKYASRTTGELIALLATLQGKVQDVESSGERIAALESQLQAEADELQAMGEGIEQERLAVKPQLEAAVNGLLTEVGFKQAQFVVEVTRSSKPSAKGLNAVRFMIATNPGLPAGELSSTASGGEISRVMLAVKAAMADKSDYPVLIFDEIDTGISGEIANKVGNVMRSMAGRFQLFTITHLPQIAGKGTEHFEIYKQVTDGKTASSVRQLTDAERVEAIARMISGDALSDAVLSSARELLGT